MNYIEINESAPKGDILKASQSIGEESKTWQDVDIKVETEIDSENKEPKDEVEVAPKPETVTNRMILDVDKFEPIESDEDDVLCDRLDIKTEIETTDEKSMEAHSYKQEPISEDSKSQDNADTQGSMDDVRQPLADDGAFDLDDSKATGETVLPKNEIDDAQPNTDEILQKLHSFHSENLMILQTRNKKRASRATTPTSDDAPNTSAVPRDSFLASTSISDVSSKTRRFSVDEDCEFTLEPTMKNQPNEDESAAYSQYQTDASVLQQNPVALSQLITPSHSYSYGMNRIEPSQTVSSLTQMYQTAPPPPPPPSSFPNSALGGYHYLENSSRTPTASYSTGYSTAPHMFTMNTSVPPPTLLNSSNYLTKSYTTLSEPSTPVSSVPPSPIGVTPAAATPSSATTPINPKVLSRTQSADPRLNPQKDLPPVTPKRKLSINEYRKRKQLTTSTEKPKGETTEKAETPAECTKDLHTDDKPKNGMATVVDATKETGNFGFH